MNALEAAVERLVPEVEALNCRIFADAAARKLFRIHDPEKTGLEDQFRFWIQGNGLVTPVNISALAVFGIDWKPEGLDNLLRNELKEALVRLRITKP